MKEIKRMTVRKNYRLPKHLARLLERIARKENRSESEIVREAIQEKYGHLEPPRSEIPLEEWLAMPPGSMKHLGDDGEGIGEFDEADFD